MKDPKIRFSENLSAVLAAISDCRTSNSQSHVYPLLDAPVDNMGGPLAVSVLVDLDSASVLQYLCPEQCDDPILVDRSAYGSLSALRSNFLDYLTYEGAVDISPEAWEKFFSTPQGHKWVKQSYRPGTRLMLDKMNDEIYQNYHPIAPGTCGRVSFIDRNNTVYMIGDTGDTFGLIFGVDKFHNI